MILLDGKALALERRSDLAGKVEDFVKTYGIKPCLAVVLVGEDPASHVYVKNKMKACEAAGFKSVEKRMSADATQSQVLAVVDELNRDGSVHGILVQLPLPKQINEQVVTQAISPLKDADGLHFENMGLLFAGQMRVAPCTPWGVIQLLKKYQIPMAGARSVVVGRSQIVGRPMGMLLLAEDATVTYCHSRTKNLRDHLKQADIVVVAAGKPNLLGKDDFLPGTVIVDVGIHRLDSGKLCGDVRFAEVKESAKAITPVPGGVGPMTIAMLLENTLKLAELRLGKRS